MSSLQSYSRQQILDEDVQSVLLALRSDLITRGPLVDLFEGALAKYVEAKYAIAMSNGTIALELLYRALRPSVVVTSPLTFAATANAALMAGSRVSFVDVDRKYGVMDPHPGLTPPEGALLVPVHFAGVAARIPKLIGFGGEVTVVEDACHALGATCYDGCSRVGSCAHSLATVFSFHPVKPITTGEGGMITTNDEALAQELRSLRDHGRESGLVTRLGTNAWMTDMQAALGLTQLTRCDTNRAKRCALASCYDELLSSDFDPSPVCGGSHHLYPIRVTDGQRDRVKRELWEEGIGCQVHYSPIVPMHPYYRETFGYVSGQFPEAEEWAAEELSLPLHAGMSIGDVDTVCELLKRSL